MAFSGPLFWPLLLALPAIALYYILYRRKKPDIPIVNDVPGDFTHKKAYAAYMSDARTLIRNGFMRYNGPFRILTPFGSRVILPPSFSAWVKANTDTILSHAEIVKHEYLAWVPGFEGNKVIHEPDHIIIDVTRTKLSQNAGSIEVMHSSLVEAMNESWHADDDWNDIPLAKSTVDLLSRVAAAVFVGPTLARDSEWLELTTTYTMNVFMGVRALRAWPAFLCPLVHWFVKECRASREQVKLARRKIDAELARRKTAAQSAEAQGRKAEIHDDALTWVSNLETKGGHSIDPAAAQLAFALASLHTTTQLLQQSITDIAARPELVEALRDEISLALEEGDGWTAKALAQMQLLDSCIKETQRLKPGILVNLERQVVRDVIMPNGVLLPRGTNIAVDSSAMWDPEVYESPQTFDAYRFLRLRQGATAGPGGKGDLKASMAQLASSSEDHFAFGLGKSVCPGRFLVATETKLALAEMLINWDIRLKVGTETKVLEYGFEMLSNPGTILEARRRN